MTVKLPTEAAARDLVAAIVEGDHHAFEAFYRMEHDNLLHFVTSYTHDAAISEDLVQDTLLRIWEIRERLDPEGNIRALCFTIAQNRTLDHLRTRTDVESMEACLCLEDRSMTDMIDALDLSRLIGRTFGDLPPKLRSTFLMSRMEGLSYSDIADREQISVKAVEYRISKVLGFLKKFFR